MREFHTANSRIAAVTHLQLLHGCSSLCASSLELGLQFRLGLVGRLGPLKAALEPEVVLRAFGNEFLGSLVGSLHAWDNEQANAIAPGVDDL